MDHKNITLNGGKTLTFNFAPETEGGTPREPLVIKVRQVPVRDYETGFAHVNDEPALVGFLCAKDKPWALALEPEVFEEILNTGRTVNQKGFFSFCQRRMERLEKQQADMLGLMGKLPPEALKLVTELGRQNLSASPTLSPGFVTPPVR